MKLIVLLSTYNGEKYLAEQLDSLLEQDLRPDKIIIRDDGSSDETVKILQRYSERYPFIEYSCGKNLGAGRSFFQLLRDCEQADLYALCDQDDVWFKDKLACAVAALNDQDQNIPLLYASRYILTDEKLAPLPSDVSSLYRFSDLPHALLYHSAPGCTFVFNDKVRQLVLRYDPDKQYFLIHDAIIHKVVTLFGKMILDERPHIYYRQHGSNEIGMSADRFKTFVGRIERFVNGSIRNYRSLTAKSLLEVYGSDCSPEARELLRIVADYKEDPKLKKELLKRECFRSGSINDLFFMILVLVNYI